MVYYLGRVGYGMNNKLSRVRLAVREDWLYNFVIFLHSDAFCVVVATCVVE